MDFTRTVPLARNVELKARVRDLAAVREIANRVATEYLGIQLQTDTYFNCPRGRLKLREIELQGATAGLPSSEHGAFAQLIAYSRPDEISSKGSDYLLVDVPDPSRLKQALADALGIIVVVAKRREIFLHENVRIHLDEVSGLGTFLEFEAVLNSTIDDAAGRAQVAKLQQEFGIGNSDLTPESYSDLLLRDAN